MFNLNTEVARLEQLEVAKIKGLPYKPKPKNPTVKHVDDKPYDTQAESEHRQIKKAFRPRTIGFGKRIRKRRGETHKRRGHYQSFGYRFTGLPLSRR